MTEQKDTAQVYAEHFAEFRKSDKIVIYNGVLKKSPEVFLGFRIYLRGQANSKYFEEYRIERVGEWLAINLPQYFKRFDMVAADVREKPGGKDESGNTRDWKCPEVFTHFKTGLDRGKKYSADLPPPDQSPSIRYEVVRPS